MEALVERLEQAVVRLEAVAIKLQNCPGGLVNGDISSESESMEAFDHLLSGPVSEYLRTSTAIGGDVAKHAEMVNNALQVQRAFLKMAMTHQEPAKTEMAYLLRPLSDQIQEVQNFREKKRGSSLFNHLSAVSESIPALGWVAVVSISPCLTLSMDSVVHVEWVNSYLSIWTELQTYIKEHHTTGLIWSKTGPVAPLSLFGAPSDVTCPPPPPPPGPPPVFLDNNPKSDDTAAQHSALFAQLNQGEAITKGLKHVSDKQKTHKNPNLRSQGGRTHQASPAKSQNPSSSACAPAKKHSPVLELEGKKWRVEHQEQSHDLVIEETELRQVVYVFSCSNSTLQIKGKGNSIIMDNCKKLGLVFDSVVGIVEIINSRDIQLQVMGKVPTISINKTEGCHVYLSKDSLDCEIVSAKSSEMNVLVPEGEDDYREFPIPEQFKTVWDGSSLVTEPTKIAG
uniref:Adenylyl cyclase-associated protein n=1 Tax=Cyprinus carpio TaxID=7962 RepID=A0A8C2KV33_CYPCA